MSGGTCTQSLLGVGLSPRPASSKVRNEKEKCLLFDGHVLPSNFVLYTSECGSTCYSHRQPCSLTQIMSKRKCGLWFSQLSDCYKGWRITEKLLDVSWAWRKHSPNCVESKRSDIIYSKPAVVARKESICSTLVLVYIYLNINGSP